MPPARTIKAKQVITGHANADFDAFAAMIAARRLYPEAVLVFPGSQEKSLRHFLIESATYLFDLKNPKDIDPESVELLVVVDTRQRQRVDHLAAVLERDDVVIHTYDHHPDSDDDLPSSGGLFKEWGATTSIIIHELIRRGLTITPDEATILGCGIYEDTGSFTFNSTTSHDFTAAAWLLSQGMDLLTISDLINRNLTPEQISLLNTLLSTATTHDINGVPVVIAETTVDHYVGDFAMLVHKMIDMENIHVLFALGRMEDRIHVVARSRMNDVDVGRICSLLGGGGHAYAASATIKERTLSQVKDELFALLFTNVNPRHHIRDIMSRPPIPLEADQSVSQAVEVMTRYGFKAMPVVETGTMHCVGVLDHQIADKALSHGLGDIPVNEYMQRNFDIIAPASDLHPVMETIVGQRQRLVPVVEDGELTGVVTRTDLINILIEDKARIPTTLFPEKQRERNIRSLVRERVPDRFLALLTRAGELGDEMHCSVFLVGGSIRDMLLHRPNLDFDLVVEGDGIAFAKALAAEFDGRVRSHHKFKTAIIILPDDFRIDIATARLEYYEYPAALPMVELSSIKMDLFRRDFTINTLAVQLNPANFGRLIDFFGAQRDIKDKLIRVLHSLSFVEDPTRILRAIRFEQRYGFRIGPQTERLVKNALKLDLVAKLSGTRLFHEFKLILDEETAIPCLERMQSFGILAAIHPKLPLSPKKRQVLEEVETVLSWYRLLYQDHIPESWSMYLMGLCMGWKYKETLSLAQRFNFSKRQEREFLELRLSVFESLDKLSWWSNHDGAISSLSSILSNLPLEGVLFVMARSRKESIRKHISQYLTSLKHMSTDIGGEDLIELGLVPGPLFGTILDRVLAAKYDGKVTTRVEQLVLAGQIARELAEQQPGKGSGNMDLLPVVTAPMPRQKERDDDPLPDGDES